MSSIIKAMARQFSGVQSRETRLGISQLNITLHHAMIIPRIILVTPRPKLHCFPVRLQYLNTLQDHR
jgi:hypothetical protein